MAGGDSIVRMTGAEIAIGAVSDRANSTQFEMLIADRWYTKLIPPPGNGAQGEMLFNAHFARGLGASEFRAGGPHIADSLRKRPCSDDYFVVFPGASWHGRKWPREYFGEIARRVYSGTGWKMVICGGPEEADYNRELANITNVPCDDRTGQTSLLELVGVIAGAHVVISNETSAVHIAAALGIPSVCVLGGGHFGRFLPYLTEKAASRPFPVPVYQTMDCFNCNWRCIYRLTEEAPTPCVEGVSVDQVWEAVAPFTQAVNSSAR